MKKPENKTPEQRIRELEQELALRDNTIQALSLSKKKCNFFVNTIPDIAYQLDADGIILFVSDSVEKYGYSAEDLTGKHISSLIHPEDRENAERLLMERRTGERGTRNLEVRLFNQADQAVDFEIRSREMDSGSVFLVFTEGLYSGQEPGSGSFLGTIGIARDITERKSADAARKESDDRYRAIVDNAADAIYLSDSEGRIVEVNKGTCDMLGYSEDELLGLTISDIDIKHTDVEDFKNINQHILAGKQLTRQSHHRKKDGSLVPVEIRISKMTVGSGGVLFLGIARDMTEKKSAEEALVRERDRIAYIMRTSPVGITFVDKNGIIINANDMAEDILGLEKGDIVHRTYNDPAWKITDYDGRPFPTELLPFSLAKAKGHPVFDIRHAIEWPDGRRVLLSINASPLFGDNGEFDGIVATVEDVTEKVKVEQTLRENEEFLRRVFESDLLILTLSRLDGTFVMINDGFTRYTGYTSEEVVGKTVYDIDLWADPHDRDHFTEILNTTGTVSGYESKYRIKSGEYIYGLLSANFITYRGKPHILTLSHDISVQKEAELALKNSERQFRSIIENSPFGIHMYAEDGNGDLILVGANPAADRLLGIKHVTLFGRKILDAFPTLGHDIPGHYKAAAENGILWHGEDILYKDGKLAGAFSVHAFQTSPGKMVSVFIDITERKKYEEELTRLSDLLTASIEQTPAGILIADAPDVTIRLVNTAALDIKGVHDIPLEGISIEKHAQFWDVRYSDSTPYNAEDLPLVKAILRGEATKNVSAIIMRSDGTPRDILINASPVRNGNGDVVAGVVVFNDVSDQKKAEESRRQLEAQLLQAQKMESIGRLAGGIAHDFNNLLTVIVGTSELAITEISPDLPFYDDFIEIKNTADRAAELTRQLLGFSRRQIIAPKILDLNDVLLNMDKMLRRLIGEDIEFVIIPRGSIWPVNMDTSQVEQVLTNLVVNARDAMPDGGKLTIETHNTTLDESYTQNHAGTTPGDYVMLAVSDTGKGMDKETISHIFEPFFTTKKVGEGTGLGLSTCYGIMKQNGGSIWAYSEKDQGTTIKCYFPRTDDDGSGGADSDEDPIPAGTETVLVVEDEPSLRRMIKKILAGRGYEVITAVHGEDAMSVADRMKGKIDMLLTDVIMPRMGGRELSQKLTKRYPAIKVLYMSGYTDNSIVHHGVLDQGVSFIQKPFTPVMLLKKLREVLDSSPGS